MMKFFFDFSRQCRYLQLEKTSSIDFETPIQKRLANDILKGWAKRTPPGSDRVKIRSLAYQTTHVRLGKKAFPHETSGVDRC